MESQASIMANTTETQEEIYKWDSLEPVPVKYAYSGMILTVVFFQILNKIVGNGNGSNGSKIDAKFWKWKNLYISWIHAVIVGLWDISW